VGGLRGPAVPRGAEPGQGRPYHDGFVQGEQREAGEGSSFVLGWRRRLLNGPTCRTGISNQPGLDIEHDTTGQSGMDENKKVWGRRDGCLLMTKKTKLEKGPI
jgi:hypothetical protein